MTFVSRVMTYMASQCGYGVDVVPSGTPFEPPATLIDQAADGDGGGGGDGDNGTSSSSSSSSFSDDDELAISTVDLQRYLSDGKSNIDPPRPNRMLCFVGGWGCKPSSGKLHVEKCFDDLISIHQ